MVTFSVVSGGEHLGVQGWPAADLGASGGILARRADPGAMMVCRAPVVCPVSS